MSQKIFYNSNNIKALEQGHFSCPKNNLKGKYKLIREDRKMNSQRKQYSPCMNGTLNKEEEGLSRLGP
jgi:hypothetical protein